MLALRGNIFVLVDRCDSNSRTVNSGSREIRGTLLQLKRHGNKFH